MGNLRQLDIHLSKMFKRHDKSSVLCDKRRGTLYRSFSGHENNRLVDRF